MKKECMTIISEINLFKEMVKINEEKIKNQDNDFLLLLKTSIHNLTLKFKQWYFYYKRYIELIDHFFWDHWEYTVSVRNFIDPNLKKNMEIWIKKNSTDFFHDKNQIDSFFTVLKLIMINQPESAFNFLYHRLFSCDRSKNKMEIEVIEILSPCHEKMIPYILTLLKENINNKVAKYFQEKVDTFIKEYFEIRNKELLLQYADDDISHAVRSFLKK